MAHDSLNKFFQIFCTGESFEKPSMDTRDAECADASCAMPCAPQETIQHESLPVTPASKAASDSPSKEVVDSALIVRRKNFVLSKIDH